MNVEASAGRSKFPVADYCESMKLRADCVDEARFLAMLYRAARSDGTVTINIPDRGDVPGRKLTIRFGEVVSA